MSIQAALQLGGGGRGHNRASKSLAATLRERLSDTVTLLLRANGQHDVVAAPPGAGGAQGPAQGGAGAPQPRPLPQPLPAAASLVAQPAAAAPLPTAASVAEAAEAAALAAESAAASERASRLALYQTAFASRPGPLAPAPAPSPPPLAQAMAAQAQQPPWWSAQQEALQRQAAVAAAAAALGSSSSFGAGAGWGDGAAAAAAAQAQQFLASELGAAAAAAAGAAVASAFASAAGSGAFPPMRRAASGPQSVMAMTRPGSPGGGSVEGPDGAPEPRSRQGVPLDARLYVTWRTVQKGAPLRVEDLWDYFARFGPVAFCDAHGVRHTSGPSRPRAAVLPGAGYAFLGFRPPEGRAAAAALLQAATHVYKSAEIRVKMWRAQRMHPGGPGGPGGSGGMMGSMMGPPRRFGASASAPAGGGGYDEDSYGDNAMWHSSGNGDGDGAGGDAWTALASELHANLALSQHGHGQSGNNGMSGAGHHNGHNGHNGLGGHHGGANGGNGRDLWELADTVSRDSSGGSSVMSQQYQTGGNGGGLWAQQGAGGSWPHEDALHYSGLDGVDEAPQRQSSGWEAKAAAPPGGGIHQWGASAVW